MRKLIDLDEATFEFLSIMAIKSKKNLKNFIEDELKKIAKKHKSKPFQSG